MATTFGPLCSPFTRIDRHFTCRQTHDESRVAQWPKRDNNKYDNISPNVNNNKASSLKFKLKLYLLFEDGIKELTEKYQSKTVNMFSRLLLCFVSFKDVRDHGSSQLVTLQKSLSNVFLLTRSPSTCYVNIRTNRLLSQVKYKRYCFYFYLKIERNLCSTESYLLEKFHNLYLTTDLISNIWVCSKIQ